MSKFHPAHCNYHRSLFNTVCHDPISLTAALIGAEIVSEGAALGAFFACDVTGAAIVGAFGISAATAGTLVAGIAGFAVSTAINAVGQRLFESSPAHGSNVVTGYGAMVKSAVQTHKIVYGQAKLSGPIVFAGTTNDATLGANAYLHLVIALTGHEVQSIDTLFLNDKPVTIGTNNYVNSAPYWNTATPNIKTIATAVRTAEIVTVTTSATHSYTTGDVVNIDSTSDLSLCGDFIILSTPSGTTFTYANGGPNISATGGTATDNTNLSDPAGYVYVKKHLGGAGQAADADMVSWIPGWDTSHKLSGISYVYIRMQYNVQIFGSGIPNVSVALSGKKVYDPRSGLTTYSTNSALCTRDYLVSDYGFNCNANVEINDTFFTAAANHCDEAVTLTTGGTQPRYTCNGILDTAAIPLDNLNQLVASMAGTVTYVQGQFRGYAGVYDATVGDITTSMLAGEVDVQLHTPIQQLYNAVQGTYIDPALNYIGTDFPAVTNAQYETDDGGNQIFKDIQLGLTNHQEAAQRIATIIEEQGRLGTTIQLPLNHAALQYCVWDTITYTDPFWGWDHKVFRIKNMMLTGTGIFTLICQEEDSAAYDWNSGQAITINPAGNSNLPDPFIVGVPGGVSFSSRSITTTGADTVVNIVVNWTQSTDSFILNGGEVEIQYKLHSDSAWRPSFFVAGDQITADLPSSAVGVAYDIRIRNVSSLGGKVHSNWVELDNCIVGSSGGIGTTNDWDNWTDGVGTTADWTNWTNAVGTTADWGYFT